jgi:hypothetical protein
MADSPRYEYRIFAPDLHEVEATVRAMAPLARYRESLETYLVTARGESSLKIRDGALELKRRIGRTRKRGSDLEQWRPEPSLGFPLDRLALRRHLEALTPTNAQAPQLDDDATASPDALIGALRALPGEPAIACVFKRRWGFSLDDCLVELVDVLVNGARIASTAVEAEDPEAVAKLLTRLAIDGRENVGYGRALARVLGLVALPESAYYNAERRTGAPG